MKIWNYNLPRARIIPIPCGSGLALLDSFGESSNECKSTSVVPVNLHTCRESRAEGLKRFKLRFGIAQQPGRIFFNVEEDVLYFGPRDGYMASTAQIFTFLSLCNPVDLQCVRKIAINDLVFWDERAENQATATRFTNEIIREICSRMPKLQEIFVSAQDNNPVYSADIGLVPATAAIPELAARVGAAISRAVSFNPRAISPRWHISMFSIVASGNYNDAGSNVDIAIREIGDYHKHLKNFDQNAEPNTYAEYTVR